MNGANLLPLALVTGFAGGLVLGIVGKLALIAGALSLKPIGALWLAGLKMTLVPLVFSLVATAVNTLLAERSSSRTIATTLAVF